MAKYPRCPSVIEGTLEISKNRAGAGVFIGGDPKGLRSLAKILIWLADVDQESHSQHARRSIRTRSSLLWPAIQAPDAILCGDGAVQA